MRESKIIATDIGFISQDDLEEYKKKHMQDIVKSLAAMISDSQVEINEKDIDFSVEESEETEN